MQVLAGGANPAQQNTKLDFFLMNGVAGFQFVFIVAWCKGSQLASTKRGGM